MGDTSTDLSTSMAPARDGSPDWVDIPVSADQPVEVALLCYFLSFHGVTYEASRRFVSVPADDAVALVPEIEIWAFDHDLPDDDRHSDSLAATQRRLGGVVLDAIEATTGHRSDADRERAAVASAPVTGILVRTDGHTGAVDLHLAD